jgi:hypothetical protein
MAIIPFAQLAQQLDTTTDKVRAAMREIAAAGHGDTKRNTLHIARWTPTVTSGEHTPQNELAGATAPR